VINYSDSPALLHTAILLAPPTHGNVLAAVPNTSNYIRLLAAASLINHPTKKKQRHKNERHRPFAEVATCRRKCKILKRRIIRLVIMLCCMYVMFCALHTGEHKHSIQRHSGKQRRVLLHFLLDTIMTWPREYSFTLVRNCTASYAELLMPCKSH